MEVLVCLISILFVIYITNLGVCFVYCTIKKKQDAKRLVLRYSDKQIEEKTFNRCENRKKVYDWIKSLMNGWMMYSVMKLGKVPCQTYRKFVLKNIYQMDIGDNVVIYGGFRIRAPWNISIGKGTVIGDGCQLDGRNGLYIGSNVNMSTEVYIYTEQHDVNDAYFASANSGGKVIIGDRAWLSSRTTVLPKVHIGEGAVLASGALACKNLDEYSIYVGIPARKVGERTRDLRYEFDGNFLPFY